MDEWVRLFFMALRRACYAFWSDFDPVIKKKDQK